MTPPLTNIFKDVHDRLLSPHGTQYAEELAELNARYPADYVFSNATRTRHYLPGVVTPSEAELWDADQFDHTWTPKQHAEWAPRYAAYLAQIKHD